MHARVQNGRRVDYPALSGKHVLMCFGTVHSPDCDVVHVVAKCVLWLAGRVGWHTLISEGL